MIQLSLLYSSCMPLTIAVYAETTRLSLLPQVAPFGSKCKDNVGVENIYDWLYKLKCYFSDVDR